MRDPIYGPIDEDTALPKELVSCPGCGYRYGHHKTMTCANCEECERCCHCKKPKLLTYDRWRPILLAKI